MASDTIIIECNRQIALKQELDTLGGIVEDPHNRFTPPNNKWKNIIQSGIPINTGDQVAVEATMINTKGTPDETIEFLGDNNSTNTADLVDNATDLEINYYINNLRQFNFNLPCVETGGAPVFRITGEATAIDYGLPNLTTFASFQAQYPSQSMEGFEYSPGTNPGYASTPLAGGVFSNSPEGLVNPSPKRLYCIDKFIPSNTATGLDSALPLKRTTTIRLDVEEGFNTPDAVANRLTSQLQGRLGNANSWSSAFVEPKTFTTDTGVLVSNNEMVATTTPTYAIIPTSTGALAYGRADGTYTAGFVGETSGVGANYTEQSGIRQFYGNLLSADPDCYLARCALWNYTHDDAGEIVNINKTNFGNFGMCKLNQFEVCFADLMNTEAHLGTEIVADSPTTNQTLTNPVLLKLDENSLIPTNLIYNSNGLLKQRALRRAREFLPDSAEAPVANLDPRNPAIDPFFDMEMPYGRASDLSLGINKAVINLSPPDLEISGAFPGG